MTIFGIDISNNNGVVDIDRVKAEGFKFVFAKVSEGDDFKDMFWPRTRDWCRQAGLVLAGYHYVREGDAGTQAETFVTQLGDRTIPAMLDFENGSGGIENFWAVKGAIEARGIHVALSYIPRWYWEHIGSPELSGVPGLIQSSYAAGTGYASVLYPGDSSSFWNAFGGKFPDILQFTNQAQVAGKILDANAFRGTIDQLCSLLNPAEPSPNPEPVPGDVLSYVRDIKAQLTGSPELGEYPGYSQLDNMTVVDFLADLGKRIGQLENRT
ncbi:glycoside hydrolase family 25 protein [Mycobacteroides abscessus]|uniref:glycoside hydrolase family 25 protein n=1 Tax=Mycobacteroides abscessus TaxID=36809 RepID=UPI0009C95B7F|nr:GH25 family lysozyme [Mycobacteroides abscessus]SLF47352.1 gp50 protein [Mycobacteroides abscessus subsp. abscessus]